MKINTSEVENFEEMSADELRDFIKGYEYDDKSEELAKLKGSFDRASSDCAKYKKEIAEKDKALQAKLSEDEKKEYEASKAQEALKAELEALRKEKEVSKYEAEYLALGYSKELATETANAMVEGNTSVVFENHKKFNEMYKASLESEQLDKQPNLTGGKPINNEDAEKLEDERLKKAFGIR